MKVSVLQENLARGIATVKPAVAQRSTLPILGNVLLSTEGGRLTVSATNLEVGIVTHVGAQVHTPGSITLPAKALSEYVNALPPDRVDLELNAKTSTVHFDCARYTANLKGITAEEFPVIPRADATTDRAGIEPDVLKQIIARSVFSAAKDDFRPSLACVYAEFQKASLRCVTADGFRLSVACANLARALTEDVTQLIPARTLGDLARLVQDQEEPVFVAFTDNETKVIFELADTVLVCNLQVGNFPDFQQIVPKTHATRVVLNSHELQHALKAQTVFARDANMIVRLDIQPENDMGNGLVSVASESAEVGDGATTLDATVDGEGLTVAFNSKYLQEAVEACASPQVAFELVDSTAPGVIKPVGRDDFTHVIMPMHIGKMEKPIL